MAVAPDGTVYFDVGSSSNASPGDRTSSPPRAVIMAVSPDGHDLRVVETGVRNGEGLAVAPDGSVWTAVNERDNVTYPFHSSYAGQAGAFGQVIQAYVNDHPPDEVARVTAGRDLGWPYCNPDQDKNHPAGSLADVPFVADAVTNPGGIHLDCAALPPAKAGLPAHSAPLGMSFLEGSAIPARWSGGAVVAVHALMGPPAAPPPGRPVDGVGRREAHPGARGHPGHRIPERRRQPLGPPRRRRARTGRRPVHQRRHRRRHLPPGSSQITSSA